ncbi:Relaxase/mobilization nuclease family protein [Solidesulfovibrio carbinoliphilus subsp. oakridgensis]|uniref:Relaxase/mobilization nuclease family protein n=1 Tax=Solidesulfovibrio carbinoliphilus subsp. oakridgensis TaxID=694327 RepID=G7QBJ9_9BACT|nr:TraI/MobA(P) family conjugative relaxase [Solidesulfovibrio carbinoliphilus]EHJ48862.1 Relaxase/mobilization nuclease family protein [Solidesulfovibrio carbinoliphilus subsp. oakridgensis]
MISRHISSKVENDDYRRLARYIRAANLGDEKSLMSWCAGCWAEDDYELAIQEVTDTQDLNTRSAKEKTYHLIVSFRPEDEAKLTPETLKEIELEFAKALGFEEHQRHCGVHKNTNNLHMHVAYNMIHPEKLARHEPYRDYYLRDHVCRELEKRFGLAIDNGRTMENAGPKLTPVAATVEAQTGQQSFDGYVKERREPILETLGQAAGWQQVHAAFARYGLEIKPHGNGLAIKDRNGKHAIKASSLDRSLSMMNLVRRFGAYAPPDRAKTHSPGDERYTAKPVQREPNRGALYEEYQAGIGTRKVALGDLTNRAHAELEAVRTRWDQERQKISREFYGRHRFELLKIARLHEAEHRLKVRKRINAERETVRQETPYSNWTNFLRCKAGQGNEVALAILRSKAQLVEPESETSRRGQREDIQEKWLKEQLEIMTFVGVSSRARRGLLAVTKAGELAEMETSNLNRKRLFSGFTSSIDTKGTVFLRLASGGMIRDTGKQIIFSTDEITREAALLYAKAKWGRSISLADNIVSYFKRDQAVEINH